MRGLSLWSDIVGKPNVELIASIRIRNSLSSRNRWCIWILGLALLSDFGSVGIGGRAVRIIGFRLVGGPWLPTGLLAGRLLISRVQYNTRGIDGDARIVIIVGRIIVVVLELRRWRCGFWTRTWW